MTAPEPVLRFWRTLDDLFGSVRPTRWGAVVTDGRFPAIWDVNYARVDEEAEGLTSAEIERDLLPALTEAGAEVEHVVTFDPGAARNLLAELSTRGHRLSWDLVMTMSGPTTPASTGVVVRELGLDDEGWRDVRASLSESFGVEPGTALEQMSVLEREVLASAGKRWFGVRRRGRWVSVAALLMLDGVGYVDNVATTPRFRGRGYASAVTTAVVDAAGADGVETIFLLADPDEAAVVRMYERLGFRQAGRLASTRGPLPP